MCGRGLPLHAPEDTVQPENWHLPGTHSGSEKLSSLMTVMSMDVHDDLSDGDEDNSVT